MLCGHYGVAEGLRPAGKVEQIFLFKRNPKLFFIFLAHILAEVTDGKLAIVMVIEVKPVSLKMGFIIGQVDQVNARIFVTLKHVLHERNCDLTKVGHLRSLIFQEDKDPVIALQLLRSFTKYFYLPGFISCLRRSACPVPHGHIHVGIISRNGNVPLDIFHIFKGQDIFPVNGFEHAFGDGFFLECIGLYGFELYVKFSLVVGPVELLPELDSEATAQWIPVGYLVVHPTTGFPGLLVVSRTQFQGTQKGKTES